MNKKLLILCFIFLGSVSQMMSQKKFIEFSQSNGVVFLTKWTHEKWYSRKSPLILSVKVINKNESTVEYSLGVDFFLNGKLAEQNHPVTYCLKSGKSAQGKLNGVYFKPKNISEQEVMSDWFEFELTGLEVNPVDSCPSK